MPLRHVPTIHWSTAETVDHTIGYQHRGGILRYDSLLYGCVMSVFAPAM